MFSLLSSQICITQVDGSTDPFGKDLDAYYKFNAGSGAIAYDSSGNGIDGRIFGATWITGMFDNGLSFDGVDDYVECDLKNFGLALGDATSYTFWLNTSQTKSASVGDNGVRLMGSENDALGTTMLIEPNVPELDKFNIILRDDNQKKLGARLRYPFDFTGTGWHHFAFIVNPQTNTVDIYIDGVPRSVSYYHQESPSSFSNFQYPFAIGAGYTAGAAGTFYEGFIDEVRIYHRALNEAEVRFLSGIRPPYSLGVHVSKNYQESVANITALDDSKMTIGTVAGYSSYSWIVDSGLYYLQASISHNDFIYTSEEIEVDVLGDTVVAINFPFSDLSASCVDIANQPLDDCTIIFNRENEEHTTSTNSSGLATIEAYYGNWSVEAFWMDVPVGEGHLIVNQSQTVLNLQCMVGDFTFIAVNPFGNPVEADVTLFNESFDVSLSDHHHKTQGNLTFSQIPLLTYDLTISGDFGTQNYHVDVGQTRYIRVETLPLFSKAIFIIIGVTIGILIALIGKRVFAKQETTIWR